MARDGDEHGDGMRLGSAGGDEGLDRAALGAEAAGVGVELTPAATEQLCTLAQLVQTAGFNLTGLRGWSEFRRKHLVDSLASLRALRAAPGESVVDVGSGAGFPGLVVAIACPENRVTLVEANGKKARFLESAVAGLRLANVAVVQARAEVLARDPRWRERADAVIARAVAPLDVLAEWTLPLCRIGGRLVALKGPRAEKEWEGAASLVERLGGGRVEWDRFILPGGMEQRVLLRIEKRGGTPQGFPRQRAGARVR
jgi:16S rRNA (guanine527-N7)-methyltransferase